MEVGETGSSQQRFSLLRRASRQQQRHRKPGRIDRGQHRDINIAAPCRLDRFGRGGHLEPAQGGHLGLIALLALAMAPTMAWAFPLGFVLGMTSIGFLTASTAIVQTEAAPDMRGRVLALQAMVFLGSTPIGGPILGVVCFQFDGIFTGALATKDMRNMMIVSLAIFLAKVPRSTINALQFRVRHRSRTG